MEPAPEMWDWVAYMDETFNDDAYWICATLIHVDRIASAKRGLDEVVASWSRSIGIPATAELHGFDLWHGSGSFVGLVPGVRRAIYDDALDALIEAEPLIILRGVAPRGLRVIHPHRLSWRYAIESVDEEMERLGGTALIVADEHVEMEPALRGDIVEYASGTTGGWRARTITRVLRGLRFLSSHEHRLLQAADLVAFLHQRRENVPVEAHRRAHTAREGHWIKVLPRIVVSRLWTPTP
jgi:hypothetical protein